MSKIGKRAIILLLALPMVINVMAQEVKKLTLEDLIPGGETYRYTDNLYGLQWWGDTCIKPDIDSLFSVDPKTGKETLLLTREKVNQVLNSLITPTNTSGEKGFHQNPVSHFYSTTFPWADKPYMLISLPQRYIIYDFKNHEFVQGNHLKEGAGNVDYCPANRSVAYTIGNNLYVGMQAVTHEPEGIICGQTVHRNEFGIDKGTFWSPQGNLLAFYRMDETMVSQYPLVDITARIGEVNNIRYPMAGMTSHQVKIGIYNPKTGTSIYLDAGDPTDRYFTNISWSPDEKSVYLIELNRDQNHSKLCQYDAETGKLISILYEEMHPKYVEPQQAIAFLPWDSTKFIYQSQRDGFNHLYLFDTKTNLYPELQGNETGSRYSKHIKATQLTKGDWLVKEVLGFNPKRKEIIFTAINGLKSGHFTVNVSNGKMNRLFETAQESNHRGILSPSGNYFIDSYSTKNEARNIDLVDTKSFKSIRLLKAKSPYEGYQLPSIETGSIKAADGTTDLCYRLIKPADFDPNKKYPVIVYVYGGPHAQMIDGGWQNGARGWDLYMANKGYILFTLDNRGSSNRGLAFENATFRRLGIEEGKDQVKGIDFLKSLSYVDDSRIGVHGWSFGGHMTTALLLRYPELFKVGVAGGPVIDWSYYEVMYGERYMDTPQSNPEGYKETNLKNLAGSLKGRLLIIHDDHDDTCVPQHTLSFMKACVDARTYPEMFIYPCHKHNVSGRDRVHLHEKITRYFEEHL